MVIAPLWVFLNTKISTPAHRERYNRRTMAEDPIVNNDLRRARRQDGVLPFTRLHPCLRPLFKDGGGGGWLLPPPDARLWVTLLQLTTNSPP